MEQNQIILKYIFTQNKKLFINIISEFYPLNENLLKKGKKYWNWELIAKNEFLHWNEEKIDKHYIFLKNHFKNLSFNQNLPWCESFIEKYYALWNWNLLSANQSLQMDEDLFEKYIYDWKFTFLIKNKKIICDEKFITKNADIIGWDLISSCKNIPWTEELIEKYISKWDWNELSKNFNLPWSIELIDKYIEKWNWKYLSSNEGIPWSNEILNKYIEKWDWENLSFNNSLPWTLNLIEKYIHLWNWSVLGYIENLPFDDIQKYYHKFDWSVLSCNGNLPINKNFIDKNKLNWYSVCENNRYLSKEIIKEYEHFIDWEQLSKNQNIELTEDLILEYSDKINWDKFCYNKKIKWNLDLLLKHEKKIISTKHIWNFLKKDINDYFVEIILDIIKENIEKDNAINWEYIKNDTYKFDINNIKIAGDLRIKDWTETLKSNNLSEKKQWILLFNFFEQRIKTRYINTLNLIIQQNINNGEGFSIVNLQCSLIETIECFINGWIYHNERNSEHKKGWYKKTISEENLINKINSNKFIFISFFENINFNLFDKIDGDDFYTSVRCALLHETQTKNKWIIKKGDNSNIAYEEKNEFKIIYRNNFQKCIEKEIQNYKIAIINGSRYRELESNELRENFISKFNHICKQS